MIPFQFMITFIEYLKDICSFPEGSIMSLCIQKEGWTRLSDVTSIPLDSVMEIALYRDDGTVEARPLTTHLRLLRAFLLFY